jgi:protein-disulfide isomerase
MGYIRFMRINVFRSSLVVMGCLIFAARGWAQDARAAKPQQALAVVAGQPIYEEDLAPSIQGPLRQLRAQEYQLKKNALERLIEQRLLEAQAQRQGVTVDKLQQEVDAKVGDPSDAELEAYYLGLPDHQSRPFNEMKAQLRVTLKQAKIQQAREEYLKQLREQAGVVVYLNPPQMEVGFDPARLRGNVHAPVTIVEFSDFQCPFCRREEVVLKELLAKYKGKVSLAYRDFPLPQIHPQAEMAAEAARCAGERGKFWEYHDLLFTDPPRLDKTSLIGDARSLGLDEDQFSACLTTQKFKPQIDADAQAASRLGVDGTPTFFINGVLVSGAQPASAFEEIIDAQLAGKSPQNPQKAASASPHD